MENSNSREYLEKITAAVIDNLRHTGPAPSVQMQDVPRKPFGGMTDEEEAELDDMDEDENKDVRMSEHRWDKRIEHEAEFEPSDDDEMARANGATRSNGNKRSFNDFRKGDKEDNSERASPVAATNGSAPPEGPAAEESHDINDDTIEDFAAEQEKISVDKEASPKEPETEKETEKESEQEKDSEKEQERVDDDGDVGMADSEPKEEMTIKEEDIEPESAPERVPSKSPVVEEEKPTENSEPAADVATDDAAADATPSADADADAAPAAAAATPAVETPAAQEESKPSPEAEPEKSPEASSDAKEKDEQPTDAMEVDQEKDEAEPKKASTPPA
jgi:histone deacetylase 1/2